jgi:hypothetical protein
VAAVRRLVRLAGGPQEAKDVIDAVAAADALEEEKEEGKYALHERKGPGTPSGRTGLAGRAVRRLPPPAIPGCGRETGTARRSRLSRAGTR